MLYRKLCSPIALSYGRASVRPFPVIFLHIGSEAIEIAPSILQKVNVRVRLDYQRHVDDGMFVDIQYPRRVG